MSITPPKGAGAVIAFAFALLVSTSLVTPPSANAGPEVTCAWCSSASDQLGHTLHGFLNPSDLCGWPNPGNGAACMRCGGTSMCHGMVGVGPCNHLACGGDNLAAVQVPLAAAIEAGDARSIQRILAERHVGVTIRDRPESGRIELLVDCAPNDVAMTYALKPSLRSLIQELVTAS